MPININLIHKNNPINESRILKQIKAHEIRRKNRQFTNGSTSKFKIENNLALIPGYSNVDFINKNLQRYNMSFEDFNDRLARLYTVTHFSNIYNYNNNDDDEDENGNKTMDRFKVHQDRVTSVINKLRSGMSAIHGAGRTIRDLGEGKFIRSEGY